MGKLNYTLFFLCAIGVNTVLAATEPLLYSNQKIHVKGDEYTVTIPQGYVLELLTDNVSSPRMLTFNEKGELFLGSKSGNVYRLLPPYSKAEVMVKLSGYPHSIAFRAGEILIARTNGLYSAPYRFGQSNIPESSLKLIAPIPGGRGHSSRTVAIGPDGRVYLSLGISGNCSDQYIDESYAFTDRRGGVVVLNEGPGKGDWIPFATGLRNPVGIDWHPVTKILYSTNNGPDHWGYDQPPEYFSRLLPGSFHGMPWYQYNGKKVVRDECIHSAPVQPVSSVEVPVATFPARNAPLGMAFVPLEAMDQRLDGDAVVALHGSWGTKPSGTFFGDSATRRVPKLVVVRFKEGEAKRVDDLVTGFQLSNGERWARPAGVSFGPDGALYFTSDSETSGLFRLRPM